MLILTYLTNVVSSARPTLLIRPLNCRHDPSTSSTVSTLVLRIPRIFHDEDGH